MKHPLAISGETYAVYKAAHLSGLSVLTEYKGVNYRQTSNIRAPELAIKLLITRMQLEHRPSLILDILRYGYPCI